MRITAYYVTYGTELLFGPCVDQETVTMLLNPIHQLDRTLGLANVVVSLDQICVKPIPPAGTPVVNLIIFRS